MASATQMLKAYDGMSNMLPQIVNPAKRMVTVWEGSRKEIERNELAMKLLLRAIQQIVSAELQAHREILRAMKAQEDFNRALDESARKGNKLIEAFKKFNLSKIAATGKQLLGGILSGGAKQLASLAQILARVGKAAGQKIFNRTAADRSTGRENGFLDNRVRQHPDLTQIPTPADSQIAGQQNTDQQAVDQPAEKENKFIKAFKSIDLAKVADVGKQFLGNILSDGAQQQAALDQISFRAGSPGAGQQIFDQTASQALRYGQDVDTAMSGTQKFMSITTDPAQLAELNMLAMRLEQLNPGQGLEGAADALSQVLSGSTEGLGSFDISAGAIDNSGVQTAGQQGNVNGVIAAMDELLNKQRMTQATFETMMDSPAVKWKRVVDTFNFQLGSIGRQGLNALGPMFDSFLEVLNSDAFKSFIDGLGAGLSIVGSFLGEVADGLAAFFGAFTSNGSSSYFIVLGIIAALGLMTIMLWAMVAPLVTQAILWLAAYWPILLIAAGIALLIGVLMNFGVSAEQIIGFVVGLFYGLYAFIYNVFALVYNLIVSFAEFWINVFSNPIYAIQKLIYDLAMTFGGYLYDMLRSAEDFAGGFMSVILQAINGALKGINRLIEGFNKLFGTDYKTIEMLDEKNIHALSDKFKNKLDSLVPPEKADNAAEFGRMQYKNIADSSKQGYSVGAQGFNDLANGANSLTSGFGKEPGSGFTGAAGQGANITNIGSVGNVGSVDRVNETVDISSEDLKNDA